MSPKIFDEQERNGKINEMFDVGFRLLKEHGMTHMSVEKITSAVGLGKGTFYHFFSSKEDFVYRLIEFRRARFWEYMEQLKDGKEKMSEENGKLLLKGIIFSDQSVYPFLSLEDESAINSARSDRPDLAEESDLLRRLLGNIENVRPDPDYGVISNLLKIMAMAAGGKDFLHESCYEETQNRLFELLFREIFLS